MAPTLSFRHGMLPRIASLLALLFLPLALRSQYKLPLHENGFIYDAATIRTLRHICDSMQERFRSEPAGGPYRSRDQTIGSFVRLKGTIKTLTAIARTMDSGATFDEIAQEFREMMIDSMREIALAKHEWRNRGRHGITYRAAPMEGPDHWISADRACGIDDSMTVLRSVGWFHTIYFLGTNDSIKEMIGLYVENPPERHPLPERYARLIQFVDFMIDTNTKLKLVDDRDEGTPGAFDGVMSAIHEIIDPPEEHSASPSSFADYLKRYDAWIEKKGERIDEAVRESTFIGKIKAAAKTGISENRSDPDLEFLVERYVSKELALELVRRRRLVRMCQSDGADIAQYNSIARLAAEAGRWDIFPRAHFQIIWPPYSRFDEITEPGERRTYVRELEAIGLDLPALMIGQALQTDNRSDNHFGLWQPTVAMIMAESEHGEEYERYLLTMIDDPELDAFNRSTMYTLYVDYLDRLGSQPYRTARLAALKERADELPAYIRHDILRRQLAPPNR